MWNTSLVPIQWAKPHDATKMPQLLCVKLEDRIFFYISGPEAITCCHTPGAGGMIVRFEVRCEGSLLNRSMANINNQVFALPLVIKSPLFPVPQCLPGVVCRP